MPAHWSEAEVQKRVAEKNAAILGERAELFKRFRAAGWKVTVIDPTEPRYHLNQKDDWILPGHGVHFLVKMPGAYPSCVKSFDALLRLAKGLS